MDLSPKGFSTASKDGPLPNPAARQQQFIGQASRIIRRQEHRNRRNIVGLSSRPQKRNRLRELLQITPDNACAMRTFRLDHARFDRVHLNFLRRQFFRKHVRHRIDRTLACGIHARSRPVARGYAEPTLMMLPPSEPKYFSAPASSNSAPGAWMYGKAWHTDASLTLDNWPPLPMQSMRSVGFWPIGCRHPRNNRRYNHALNEHKPLDS
jgi:hypothetical protein